MSGIKRQLEEVEERKFLPTGMLSAGTTSVDRVSSNAQTMTVRHGYSSSATEAFLIPDSPPSTVQSASSSVTV